VAVARWGLILGGFLTEYLNWRWTFFREHPVRDRRRASAPTSSSVSPRAPANRSPLDVPGVILSTTGLVALVYGFTPRRVGRLVGHADRLDVHRLGPCSCPPFVLTEAKVRHPLLPLRVIADRKPRRRLPLPRPRDHLHVRPCSSSSPTTLQGREGLLGRSRRASPSCP